MTINIVLAGKGGVGKSMVASCLAQYFMSLERDLYCANVDPLSVGFNSYEDFNVDQINIRTNHGELAMSKFDRLVERLIEHPGDSVIDTGGASYLPILGYLARNDVFPLLQSHGKRVLIHAPIVGGIGLEPSLRGLSALLKLAVPIVVWKNEHFGPLLVNGICALEQSESFRAADDQILGVVELFPRGPDTHGNDISLMLAERWTFTSVRNIPEVKVMQQLRYCRAWEKILHKLDELGLYKDY